MNKNLLFDIFIQLIFQVPKKLEQFPPKSLHPPLSVLIYLYMNEMKNHDINTPFFICDKNAKNILHDKELIKQTPS